MRPRRAGSSTLSYPVSRVAVVGNDFSQRRLNALAFQRHRDLITERLHQLHVVLNKVVGFTGLVQRLTAAVHDGAVTRRKNHISVSHLTWENVNQRVRVGHCKLRNKSTPCTHHDRATENYLQHCQWLAGAQGYRQTQDRLGAEPS